MKNIVRIIPFTLLLMLSSNLYALPREQCIEYAAEAETEWAFRLIMGRCNREDSFFFNRSKEFKCAVKAGSAKTERAAKTVWSNCIRD